MKTRTLEITMLDTCPANPLVPGTYPRPGVYCVGYTLYFVTPTIVTAWGVPGDFQSYLTEHELNQGVVSSVSVGGISANDLLKLMAINQKPELAVQLCGGV